MTVATSDFLPADLDGSKWDQLVPLLEDLKTREVSSAAALEAWLLDRSELESAISEAGAIAYVDMTCDTASDAKRDAYMHFVENIAPKVKPIGFELDKRLVELAGRFPLDEERYGVLLRDTRAEVEIFREENVAIQTGLAKLDNQYDQICGAMTVEYDGREQTMPQMSRYQESTDRGVRESAWTATAERRHRDVERIDEVFDQMIAQRHAMAGNAGFSSYVGYAFKAMQRFDYGPEDCMAFHDAIESEVMPFVASLDRTREARLGLERLRPWDLTVDPRGRGQLVPFRGGTDLVTRTRRIFERMSPELGEMFAALGDGSNANGAENGASLDLDSRKGKASGGYQYMRDRSRKPFIFMNAADQHRDVETMVHEAGHAFHSMYCVDEPLVHYRHAPIEFAEVASMSMELLTMPYWDAYYADEEDLARAQRKQLEGTLSMLPWIATIDAFQHWIYQHPTHTRAERIAAWNRLEERFGAAGHRVDWTGLERFRDTTWQRQGHLFGNPFYYIEYGIAQLGALGLWLTGIEQGEEAALAAYRRAMALGGSRPLPELFEATGLPFDFGKGTVARLVDRVKAELDTLPD